jgi:predicted ester cyclase
VSEAEEALKCVRRVIECDNARDAVGYRGVIHDDYVARVHGIVQTSGADAEVASLEAWWLAAPDVHLQELSTYTEGGTVTLRYSLRGTNTGEFFGRPATGRPFETEACTILEVVDGKVKRTWRFADTLGLLTQLGLLDPEG